VAAGMKNSKLGVIHNSDSEILNNVSCLFNRLPCMHRLHILTIPRQWGSVIVSRRSKTLMRAYYPAPY
jgi:hypothetical protein